MAAEFQADGQHDHAQTGKGGVAAPRKQAIERYPIQARALGQPGHAAASFDNIAKRQEEDILALGQCGIEIPGRVFRVGQPVKQFELRHSPCLP